MMKTDSGLEIQFLEKGDGPQPEAGQKVAVHYTADNPNRPFSLVVNN